MFCFFFQAEDGIRDADVTGVQTCALPILVNIRKQFGRKMHLSFIGARVFVALHFSKSLFEPRMYSSCLRFEDVSFMHALFMMNAIIIKELNLNTRIWTKE